MPRERKGGDGAIHAPRHLSHVALFAVAVVAAAALAATAHADGDPASDYLLSQQVFFPFDVKFEATQKAKFAGLVQEANGAGFKIRVALIASRSDMGSATPLYGRPKVYARFLDEELAFVYKQRLLVVMPNGLGFGWKNHPTTAAYKVLGRIPLQSGNAGMLATAELAVQRLAAADGIVVRPPAHVATTAQRNSHDRLLIIGGVVVALLAAAGGRFALMRRQRAG